MPYIIKKMKNKYKVVTKGTNKAHSKKGLSASKAKAQMRALYANVPEAGGKKK